MKIRKELLPLVRGRVEKRSRGGDEAYLHGAERVDLVHVEHERFACRVREFEFPVDEPRERGGTNQGPNPLAYFLAGAGSCLLMQYVRLAIVDELAVEEIAATVLGRFNRRIGGGFSEIVYDVRIRANEDKRTLLKLAKKAERMCYVYNTLRGAVKLTTNLYLNGQIIAKR